MWWPRKNGEEMPFFQILSSPPHPQAEHGLASHSFFALFPPSNSVALFEKNAIGNSRRPVESLRHRAIVALCPALT
ncbi:MAG: hypothetical protein EBU84_18760 [Actinobacteria bacterium]|nr:hypothetical protein [Actinomycetota bacterium]